VNKRAGEAFRFFRELLAEEVARRATEFTRNDGRIEFRPDMILPDKDFARKALGKMICGQNDSQFAQDALVLTV
jgi:hypothetical protein